MREMWKRWPSVDFSPLFDHLCLCVTMTMGRSLGPQFLLFDVISEGVEDCSSLFQRWRGAVVCIWEAPSHGWLFWFMESCNGFQLHGRERPLLKQCSLENSYESRPPRAAGNKMIWADLRGAPSRSWSGKWSPFCSAAEKGMQVTWSNWAISPARADPVLLISASCRPRASPAEIKGAPILAGTRSSAQGYKSKSWLVTRMAVGEEKSGDGRHSPAPFISADQLLPSQCL